MISSVLVSILKPPLTKSTEISHSNRMIIHYFFYNLFFTILSTWSFHFILFCILKDLKRKFWTRTGIRTLDLQILAQHSTTWAILVLMPAHVQISLLRRMPLLPVDAVMTLSVIILISSEPTSPFYMNMIFKSSY